MSASLCFRVFTVMKAKRHINKPPFLEACRSNVELELDCHVQGIGLDEGFRLNKEMHALCSRITSTCAI